VRMELEKEREMGRIVTAEEVCDKVKVWHGVIGIPKASGAMRLIVDLSVRRGGERLGVNGGVAEARVPRPWMNRLGDLRREAKRRRIGGGWSAAVTDIKSAFRRIGVRIPDVPLLGMEGPGGWKGVDGRLPMGAVASPSWMTWVSRVVARKAEELTGAVVLA